MEHVVGKVVRDVSPIWQSRVVMGLKFFLDAGGAVVGLDLKTYLGVSPNSAVQQLEVLAVMEKIFDGLGAQSRDSVSTANDGAFSGQDAKVDVSEEARKLIF
jgi:hypothetical protein